LSTVKKVKKSVAGKLGQNKREETDAAGEFFRDSDLRPVSGDRCSGSCLGGFTMEAGLLSINKLLLSVIGQPRGSLTTTHSPIGNEFKISDTVLGLGINGKVVECVKRSTGEKFALKVPLVLISVSAEKIR
jgi:hypothetical protein